MTSDSRRLVLLEAGKLKLAAMARLAEDGDDGRLEAAVLYHEAARAERRVLLSMEAPSAEATLASAIERCACLIDGLDVATFFELGWPEVLEASALVDAESAAAMRSRINPKVERFVAAANRALAGLPALRKWISAGRPWPFPRAMAHELDRYLAAFPGDARHWGFRSVVHFEAGTIDSAWDAIQRARRLMPDDRIHQGWELVLLPRVASSDAESRLRRVYADIDRGAADTNICRGFVSAAMVMARSGGALDRARWLEQAHDAAREGSRLSSPRSDERKVFRAMELSLKEMLAGRRPTLEILYRCGLGQMAAVASKNADPLDLVLHVAQFQAAA